jgi:glycosyltransferase involved in cell wall biosynthesis
MKISLTCKLDPSGAYGFIKPISDSKNISKIDVFRDVEALPCSKVKYHESLNRKNGILSQLSKLFKMLKLVDMSYKLSIGIYEIPHGLLAFLVGKIYRIPTVISIIGNPDYTKLRKGIRKKFTYFMYKRIHAVTTTGSKSRQVVIKNGISPERVFILPNSIDIERFIPREETKKKYDLISLGRLSPEKELANLLRIVKLLKVDKPDIKVGIAGKGPEDELLTSMITKMNLQKNVKFLGYVDNIVEFYNNGKVFVLTSRTEGLPRTVIEAMACGVPCVTSNVGDMGDVIDNDKNGYLINDYKNLESFVVKINLLLSDNLKYDEMSENSRRKIKKKYSYEAATKVWDKIISKIGD